MPRPSYFDIDPANVDPNGIAEAQGLTTGGGNLTLDGALCDLGTAAQFDIGDAGYSSGIGGVQIIAASTATESGLTLTITGKDQDGTSLTATMGVTTGGTELTTVYWSQITQIAGDQASNGDLTVGTVDEIITRTFPLNWRSSDGVPATYVVSGLSGTISYGIDETFDDVQNVASNNRNWIAHTATAGADVATAGTQYARAVRLKSNSYTDGAELQFSIHQNY